MGLRNPRPWSDAQFQALLAWLDADPNKAGIAYAQLHRRLQIFFEGWREAARHAEELADATIDRVLAKIADGPDITGRDPTAYVRTVAAYILKEYRSQTKSVPLIFDPPDPRGTSELEPSEDQACLRRCLDTLSSAEYKLIVGYYAAEKTERTLWRNTVLPLKMGKSYGAIRVQAMRIRRVLEECIEDCRKASRTAGNQRGGIAARRKDGE